MQRPQEVPQPVAADNAPSDGPTLRDRSSSDAKVTLWQTQRSTLIAIRPSQGRNAQRWSGPPNPR